MKYNDLPPTRKRYIVDFSKMSLENLKGNNNTICPNTHESLFSFWDLCRYYGFEKAKCKAIELFQHPKYVDSYLVRTFLNFLDFSSSSKEENKPL